MTLLPHPRLTAVTGGSVCVLLRLTWVGNRIDGGAAGKRPLAQYIPLPHVG